MIQGYHSLPSRNKSPFRNQKHNEATLKGNESHFTNNNLTQSLNKNQYQSEKASIDLSQKNIKEIPKFGAHEKVINLNLSKNQIVDIQGLPESVESLDLSENKISSLPKTLKMASSLCFLNLSRNRIINVDGISNCSQLKELYLAYNYLSDSQLENLTGLLELEVLDISHNNLSDNRNISAIENLPKLRILINTMNEYTSINLRKSSLMLENIRLDDNNITEIEFYTLKISMLTLSVKNNQLSQLKGLFYLQNLEHLYCDNNQLSTLESLEQLTNLKSVSASSNQLYYLTFPSSSLIEFLNLSSNNLCNINFLSDCLQLKTLILSSNKIKQLPDCSSSFKNLQSLDISHNNLSIASNLQRFKNLKELNLSYNSITDFNSVINELCHLKSLQNLDLRYNNFNSEFIFDISVYQNNSHSIEAIEKILLQTAQESLFAEFIKYRGLVISRLSRSLVVLDCIEITDYEISLAQRYIELSLSSLDSLSPQQNNTLNFNKPISADLKNYQNPTRSLEQSFQTKKTIRPIVNQDKGEIFQRNQSYLNYDESPQRNDISNNRPVLKPQHDSDNSKYPRLNDSVGDSVLDHKNQAYVTQEEYQKQPNLSSTVKSRDSLDLRHKVMDENITKSNPKVLMEKRIDNSPNHFERAQNTRDQQNQTVYLPVHKRKSYEIDEIEHQTKNSQEDMNVTSSSKGSKSSKHRYKSKENINDHRVHTNQSNDQEEDLRLSLEKRDYEWKRLNEIIATSQKMAHSVGKVDKQTQKESEEAQILEEDKPSSASSKIYDKNMTEISLRVLDSSTNRTNNSIIDEITQDIRRAYEQNIEDLKMKLKSSLRKSKLNGRSHSSSSNQHRKHKHPESKSMMGKERSLYAISEKIESQESNKKPKTHNSFEKQDVSTEKKLFRRNKEETSSNQGDDYVSDESRKKSEHLTKEYSTTESPNSVQESRLRKSKQAEDKRVTHPRGVKEEKNLLRSSDERKHVRPYHERYSASREDTKRTDKSNFTHDMDGFLVEKLVERLEHDRMLGDNPYFQLYKNMVAQNRKFSVSYSGTYRTGDSKTLNNSFQEVSNQSREGPFCDHKFSKKKCPRNKQNQSVSDDLQEDEKVNVSANDINKITHLDTTAASYVKHLKSIKKEEGPTPNGSNNISYEVLSSIHYSPHHKVSKSESFNFEIKDSRNTEFNLGESVIETAKVGQKKPEEELNQSIKSIQISDHGSFQGRKSSKRKLSSKLEDTPNGSNLGETNEFKKIATSVFKKNLTEEITFVDCSCLGRIIAETLRELGITIENYEISNLLQEIQDYVPRKLTEKTFLDLFHLPQMIKFLNNSNVPMTLTATNITDFILTNSNREPGSTNKSLVIESKISSLHSLSTITSNPSSKNSGYVPDDINSINRSMRSIESAASKGSKGVGIKSRSNVDEKNSSRRASIASSTNQSINSSLYKKVSYCHSLSSGLPSSKNTGLGGELANKELNAIKWSDLYMDELAKLFVQLMPYSITPPKPVLGREALNTSLKEVPHSSSECILLSSILKKFGYNLKKVVKTFNYNQNKKLDKIVEERKILTDAQLQYDSMRSRGLEDPNVLGLRHETSLQFYDKVLLFHSAKLNTLSDLIQSSDGFRGVYKENPCDLIFSHKTYLCLKQYNEFMQNREKKDLDRSSVNNSFIASSEEKAKWRLVISQVFLGNCYLEKSMDFREFTSIGEIKVLELLKNGFNSVYFEQNEVYLVLLAENCVPVYLCEYQFEIPNYFGGEGNSIE